MTTATITELEQLPEATIDTPKGTRVRVSILWGYVYVQNRPAECRGACKCGECYGRTTWHAGEWQGVTYWADNSIDGQVKLDEPLANGYTYYTVHFSAPSGDRCF